MSYLLWKTLFCSIICIKCNKEDEKIFKTEESIEILKHLGSVNHIEKSIKIYNHVWKKMNQELSLKNK